MVPQTPRAPSSSALLDLLFSLPECPFWETPTHPSKPSLRRNVACGVERLRAAAPVSLLHFLRPVSPSPWRLVCPAVAWAFHKSTDTFLCTCGPGS